MQPIKKRENNLIKATKDMGVLCMGNSRKSAGHSGIQQERFVKQLQLVRKKSGKQKKETEPKVGASRKFPAAAHACDIPSRQQICGQNNLPERMSLLENVFVFETSKCVAQEILSVSSAEMKFLFADATKDEETKNSEVHFRRQDSVNVRREEHCYTRDLSPRVDLVQIDDDWCTDSDVTLDADFISKG